VRAVEDTGLSLQPRDELERAIRTLARSASIEVTPARILGGQALSTLLPSGMSVYVPFLPRADVRDTVAACRRLIADGMVPVPHLPPRAVRSRAAMRDWLSALRDARVDALLLIAGDRREAAGPWPGTVDLLESGLLLEHGFRRLGIAGHPEGHPSLPVAVLERALAAKRDYARATGTELWIVTQFLFSTHPALAWLQRTREQTGSLPVRVGIPGPARLKTLIAYAAQCGVSASARVLRKRPGAARLLARWTPDGLLRDLAHCNAADVRGLFDGVHLFPFGGVEDCAAWLRALRADSAADRPPDAAGAPLT
jgi:methylenetetrahydrofolate reductase (NADPH)